MAYEVAREVTQPFHGPDGKEVLYSPGDRVPVDEDLEDGVRSKLIVVEVPDPVPAPRASRAKAAAKPAADSASADTGPSAAGDPSADSNPADGVAAPPAPAGAEDDGT